jgi:hypothetical protein
VTVAAAIARLDGHRTLAVGCVYALVIAGVLAIVAWL